MNIFTQIMATYAVHMIEEGRFADDDYFIALDETGSEYRLELGDSAPDDTASLIVRRPSEDYCGTFFVSYTEGQPSAFIYFPGREVRMEEHTEGGKVYYSTSADKLTRRLAAGELDAEPR